MPGSVCAFYHDDEWYLGVAKYISAENYDVDINFFQPNGSVAQLCRSGLENTCWMPIHDIITKADPPSYGSTD